MMVYKGILGIESLDDALAICMKLLSRTFLAHKCPAGTANQKVLVTIARRYLLSLIENALSSSGDNSHTATPQVNLSTANFIEKMYQIS